MGGKEKFNWGWKFYKGDIKGAEVVSFNDKNWKTIDLPHDWSIEGPFKKEYASGNAYLPGGVAWYRKHFKLEDDKKDKKVYIEFDGVYKNSEVWINGNYLAKRSNGYISFSYNLSSYLNYGEEENIIAVRVDHSNVADSRWYTGSGIYRNVHLITKDKIHIKKYGTYITTPEILRDKAVVKVETTLVNNYKEEEEVSIKNTVLNQAGEIVASLESKKNIKANSQLKIEQKLNLSNPVLWSVDNPYLYKIESKLINKTKILDTNLSSFGIRYFNFDVERGFFLNGKNMKLKGTCLHHDAGALGAAVPEKVWIRRLKLLKEMGCNAIRTSHNPPAPEFLDLCDKMGFLVQDEAFDEWEFAKNKWVDGRDVGEPELYGYAEAFEEDHEKDLRDMILRDRNHPSIICWSIGNEIDYPNDPYSHPVLKGDYHSSAPAAERMGEIARKLTNIIKEIDKTRPVTAALACVEMSNQTDFPDVLDIVGYNYQENRYTDDKREFPARVIYGSENSRRLEAWLAVENNEYISGQFLWTGIDFLGEAGRWPNRNSRAGLLDLAAFKKAEYYFRQSLWSKTPMLKLLSIDLDRVKKNNTLNWQKDVKDHWNWEGKEGKKIRVICCTNCQEIDLYFNGKFFASKQLRDFKERYIYWDIPYEKGVIKAVAKENGKEILFDEMQTTGQGVKLQMRSDTKVLISDGEDIAHVEVNVVDQHGKLVSNAKNLIYCSIDGPGKILGIENGDSQSHEDYQGKQRKAYKGKVLVYIQACKEVGEIAVKVSSTDLESDSLIIKNINKYKENHLQVPKN
ncbi:glycoside hydrolase family 2 TIM barrel-domain containing protein [Natronospora cellulosivora (SeqCode)]